MRRRGPLAAFVALGLLWGTWAALVPAVQDAVGVSKGELGLLLLLVAVASLPTMLLTGREVDRSGTRILPLAILGLAVAAVLPGLADSPGALAVALLVLGVATGATDVVMNSAVAELEARRSTRLMQLAHALFSAGVLVGAIACGIARQAGASRIQILIPVALAILVAAALNIRQERIDRPRTPSQGGLRLDRALIPIGIACGAAFVIEGGMENWGALFVERELDATPAVSALAPAAHGLSMMLGRLSGQWLERRLGDTRLLASAAAVALLGLVVVSLAQVIPLAILGFFIGGAGISIAAPALFGAGGRRASPDERGRALATVTTIGYLGFLVGPPLVGGAAEAVGLRAAFAVLALVAAALVIATPRLGLERRP